MADSSIAVSSAFSILEDQLNCSVCLSKLKDPRTLSCFHSFCLKCLKALPQTQTVGRGKVIKCPTCRRKSQLPQTGIAGLSSSFLLNNISEALHEIKDSQVTLCDTCDRSHTIAYCKQCTSYCCKDCLEVHNSQDMNKEHELVRISKELKHTNNTMQLGTSIYG